MYYGFLDNSFNYEEPKSWTAPGPDMMHTYWLKKLTALLEYLEPQMNHQMILKDQSHPTTSQ